MLDKIIAIASSVRWWAVVILLGIAVWQAQTDVYTAIQYLLGITVGIGTVDRFAEKMISK